MTTNTMWTVLRVTEKGTGEYEQVAADRVREFTRTVHQAVTTFEAPDLDAAVEWVKNNSLRLGLDGENVVVRPAKQEVRTFRVSYRRWLADQIQSAPIQFDGTQNFIEVDLVQLPYTLRVDLNEATLTNREGKVVARAKAGRDGMVFHYSKDPAFRYVGAPDSYLPNDWPLNDRLYVEIPKTLADHQGSLFA